MAAACPMLDLLHTGYGIWAPLTAVAATLLCVGLVLAIRALGENHCKRDTDQTKPFVSGNEVPEGGHHIRAGSLYWGYLEALKDYYQRLIPIHTGVATDYLLWFFGVMALVLLIGLAP